MPPRSPKRTVSPPGGLFKSGGLYAGGKKSGTMRSVRSFSKFEEIHRSRTSGMASQWKAQVWLIFPFLAFGLLAGNLLAEFSRHHRLYAAMSEEMVQAADATPAALMAQRGLVGSDSFDGSPRRAGLVPHTAATRQAELERLRVALAKVHALDGTVRPRQPDDDRSGLNRSDADVSSDAGGLVDDSVVAVAGSEGGTSEGRGEGAGSEGGGVGSDSDAEGEGGGAGDAIADQRPMFEVAGQEADEDAGETGAVEQAGVSEVAADEDDDMLSGLMAVGFIVDDGDKASKVSAILEGQGYTARPKHHEEPELDNAKWESLGHVEGFHGPLNDLSQAEKLRDVRAYADELIVISMDPGMMEWAINLVMSLEELNIGHWVIVSPNEAGCVEFEKHQRRAPACTWLSMFETDSSASRFWSNELARAATRWAVTARLAQVGVGTLLLRDDAAVRAPPGPALAHGVWADAVKGVLPQAQSEGCSLMLARDGKGGTSPDAMYVAPHASMGLASTLGEVTGRMVRALGEGVMEGLADVDDAFFTAHALRESEVLNDVLCSAASGEVSFQGAFQPDPQRDPEVAKNWESAHEALVDTCSPKRTDIPLTPALGAISRASNAPFAATLLHAEAPSLPSEWPRYRGQVDLTAIVKAEDGYLPRVFTAWMKAGDLNDGTRGGSSTACWMPDWVFSDYSAAGRRGAWAGARPRAVVAIGMAAVLPTAESGEGVLAVHKIHGWWHWRASRAVHGSGVLRAGSKDTPLPKLLALPPGWSPAFKSLTTFYAFVVELAQLAASSGRKLVWPTPHCKSAFIAMKDHWAIKEHTPTPIDDDRVIVSGPLDDLRCVWAPFVTAGCHTVGLPVYDLQFVMTVIPPKYTQVQQENTLFFTSDDAIAALSAPADFTHSYFENVPRDVYIQPVPSEPSFREVHYAGVADQLQKMAHLPIVWVGDVFRVKDAPTSVQSVTERSFQLTCNPENGAMFAASKTV